MELVVIFKAVISLLFVVALLYAALKIVQKYTNFGYKLSNKIANSDSLKLENIVYIDESTKVVTVTGYGNKRYIIGVGKNNITLIDKINDTQDARHPQDLQDQ